MQRPSPLPFSGLYFSISFPPLFGLAQLVLPCWRLLGGYAGLAGSCGPVLFVLHRNAVAEDDRRLI